MTRLIAGTAGGRPLRVPGRGTRPTSDRAREALFSALLARTGSLVGRSVLDLYAGSGAVGLEALSRGATSALLVESDARAVAVIRENIRRAGLAGARVIADRVERFAATPPEPAAVDERADIVFLDPPYQLPDQAVRDVLRTLAAGGRLNEDAVIVVERESRAGVFDWPSGFAADTCRRYGEAALWYGRAATGDSPTVDGPAVDGPAVDNSAVDNSAGETSAVRGTCSSDQEGEG